MYFFISPYNPIVAFIVGFISIILIIFLVKNVKKKYK